MVIAVHLSTNRSEITVVSNLNKAYSSEGVPTLNVASKFEFLKSLVYATVPQSPRSKNVLIRNY